MDDIDVTRSPLSPGPFSPRPQKTRRKRRERAIGATFHTLILIGCLLSLLPLQSMQAQGTNTIAYQQTVAGRLTEPNLHGQAQAQRRESGMTAWPVTPNSECPKLGWLLPQ